MMMAFIPTTSALMWGSTDVGTSPEYHTYHVSRYETTSIPITVKYTPLYEAITILPAYVTVNIVDCPTWLGASLSRHNYLLAPGGGATPGLDLTVSEQDIPAGMSGDVIIEATGKMAIPVGRELMTTRLTIKVVYDPFTQIAVSVAAPIGEARPDTKLSFPVRVTNYGNTPVAVKLIMTEKPRGWECAMSPPMIPEIPPRTPGVDTYPYETVILTVYAPHGTGISYHNKWTGMTVLAEATSNAPAYELQGGNWVKITEPIETRTYYTAMQAMLCKNKGFYVPGFDPLIAIAAIGIVAALIGRKRK
jgi:hypothetical protein